MQRKPVSLFMFFLFFLHFSFFNLSSQPSDNNSYKELITPASDEEIRPNSASNLEYYFEILDSKTPLDVQLNDEVRKQIDIFLTRRSGDIELALQRSELYFPLIEQMLDNYDLPLELKYLAVIESGLNPLAQSRSGAEGIWQFLYSTCALFDLQVDSYIDERRDLYKSTEAACKYMNYLYRTYNDWNLVMASYNGGPGDVRKAIARSGGKTDYWEIRPYLSDQTRNYVPAFLAVYYLMTYSKQNNIKTLKPELTFQNTDTLMISYAVSFQQISSIIKIPIADLEFLNPVYKRRYIPKREGGSVLVLPNDLIPVYLRNESQIMSAYVPQVNYNDLLSNAGSTNHRNRIVHTVKRGEFCHKIALNYNCTIENIKAWNNLTTTTIYPGQTLDIWVINDLH